MFPLILTVEPLLLLKMVQLLIPNCRRPIVCILDLLELYSITS